MEKCPYGVVIPVELGEQYRYFVPPWVETVHGFAFGPHRHCVVTDTAAWGTVSIPKSEPCPGKLTMRTELFVEESHILIVECSSCGFHAKSAGWTEASFNSALAVWLIAGAQGSKGEIVQAPFVTNSEDHKKYACFDMRIDSAGHILLALVPDQYHQEAGSSAMAYLTMEITKATQDTAHHIARLRGFRDFPAPARLSPSFPEIET